MKPPPPDETPWKSLGLFGVILADLVIYPGVGYGVGHWIEGTFGFGSWARVAGLLVGFGLAFFQIYRISKRR